MESLIKSCDYFIRSKKVNDPSYSIVTIEILPAYCEVQIQFNKLIIYYMVACRDNIIT